ncbi:MAG: CrcB family protein [Planctomycetota bacterium]
MIDGATKLFAIALGGALGAVARHAIGTACVAAFGPRLAIGTLAVNVAGCFVLGVLMHEAIAAGDRLPGHWHVGLTVGLLGGLTTFSTFGYQTVSHFEAGEPGLALANVAANVTLGLAAAAAGAYAARMWWPAET